MSKEIDIVAFKKGEIHAFEQVVLLFEKKVLNMCWHLLHNQQEAEDATQDIFIALYQSRNTFKGESQLSTWVYRITVNKCYEYLRRNKRKKRFGIKIPIDESIYLLENESSLNPLDSLMQKERTKQFMNVISNLTEKQRIAFTLNQIEGYSYKEVAEYMKLSLAAVESLIFRAKQELIKKLKDPIFKNWI